MRRLLKIKEFFHLKKKRSLEEEDGSYKNLPAKRHRRNGSNSGDEDVGTAANKSSGHAATVAVAASLKDATASGDSSSSNNSKARTAADYSNREGYEKFLQVFDIEGATDSLWWLPGRRGEAFAIHKERFEQNLLKTYMEEHSYHDFVDKLKGWGFQQMNIPSLSGRIVTFERKHSSQDALGYNGPSFSSSRLLGVTAQGQQEVPELGEFNRLGSSGHTFPHQSRTTSRQEEGEERIAAAAALASRLLLTQTTTRAEEPIVPQNDSGRVAGAAAAANSSNNNGFGLMSNVQLQQAHYIVQQEIAQTYFNLLWQELQRQLSVLLLQQSYNDVPPAAAAASPTTAVTTTNVHQTATTTTTTASTSSAASPRSELLELATLLQQQQLQQQMMAAQVVQATATTATTAAAASTAADNDPSRPLLERQAIVGEINALQQQQLSNLTYQIVGLVVANLEQQQDPPLPTTTSLLVGVPEPSPPSAIQRILVKYMIALVLLQLQQQQQNLEYLRQERLTALALAISNSRTVVAEDGGLVAVVAAVMPDPLNALQMQQLLSEAAMLSLSRAHQLLCEASILMPAAALQLQMQQQQPPFTAQQQIPDAPPPPPPNSHSNHDSSSAPPPPFPGTGFGGPHPPRTTTAR